MYLKKGWLAVTYVTCFGTTALRLMRGEARGREQHLDEGAEAAIANGAGATRPPRNEWIIRNRKCVFHPFVLALHHMLL